VVACSSGSATPSPVATAASTVTTAPASSSGTQAPTASPSVAPVPATSAGGPIVVNVTITNASCTPDRSSAPAGPVTFHVTNDGADRVSEVELTTQDDRILGEKENLVPGLSGDFSVQLDVGTYVIECPGADTPKSDFTVTPLSVPSAPSTPDALLQQATSNYATYVRGEVDNLVSATSAFTAAVRAGSIEQAEALYGPARIPYERIEPVAESFGDLDARIDGREDDAATPAAFTGFHRIERALWVENSLSEMGPIADQLDADVANLHDLVATETFQPAQLANGAAELLDEIARSKVTGEEERYSHLDLVDFQANLDGAHEAYTDLRPALAQRDAQLASTLDQRFVDAQKALDSYRLAGGAGGFVAFTSLTDSDTRALAQAVDALAEPLSQVAAVVVAG
jgi:iron uptake system component EfeO